jgi:hypothetical protein
MGWLKAGGGAAPLINLRSAQPEEGSILLLPFRLISGLENTQVRGCATFCMRCRIAAIGPVANAGSEKNKMQEAEAAFGSKP